jgi:hypothetical protein
MLSKLTKQKKKSESKSAKVPAWHLDFRDSSGLPDVKPVRTSFFINGIAAVVAAGIALNFFNQELRLFGLRNELAQVDAQIEADRQPSAAAVKQFQQFRAEEKKLKEVLEFIDRRIDPSEFLLRLGEILPENIIITGIDVSDGVFTLRGTVSGSPDEASGYASGLVDLLNTDEELGPLFEDAALTSLVRNPVTGLLNMQILLPITPRE